MKCFENFARTGVGFPIVRSHIGRTDSGVAASVLLMQTEKTRYKAARLFKGVYFVVTGGVVLVICFKGKDSSVKRDLDVSHL
jgi:hypothetical protein